MPNLSSAEPAPTEHLDAIAATGDQAGARLAGELVLAIALAGTIACGLCAALLLGLGHTETSESAGYLAFAAAAGAGAALARPLARRAGDLLGALAGVNAAALATIMVANWSLVQAGSALRFAALAVLLATAALVGLDLYWLRRPAALAQLAPARQAWITTAGVVALAVALLPFAPAPAQSPVTLVAAAIAGTLLVGGLAAGRRGLPRRARLALDLAFVALLALLVNDLQYHPDAAPANDVLHHLNFYVGPVNDVLHGRAVLVETFSQYGIGAIYALAALYEVTGSQLSYGSFQLVIGLLTALWFCSIYLLLRLSARSQAIAIGAVALAVLTHVFDSYSFVAYPMSGALRFGPSFLVVLVLAVGLRRGSSPRPALVLAALCSLWSIETFAYTLGAVLAFLACSAWLGAGAVRDRVRAFAAGVAVLAVATLVAQLVFALGTRLTAGSWPDWGTYIDFVRVYGSGDFGKLLIAPFSSGLALAGVLLASAVAVIVLTLRGRGLEPGARAQLPIVAALTGLGIVVYTYYLGRSAEGVQPKIGVAAVVLTAIWLDMAILAAPPATRTPRLAFAVIACAVGLLLASSASPDFLTRWKQTPLAALAGMSEITPPTDPRATLGQAFDTSLRGRVDALVASPVASAFDAETAAQELVRRHGGGRPVAVLLGPEITTEVLVRSGRANALPIATPTEDALLPGAYSRISAAAARLPAGTVLITDRSALRGDPGAPAPELLALIQEAQTKYLLLRERLLRHLRAHFVMRPLTPDRAGIAAVELTPRTRGGD